mgnify:CR=1 FL=1
MKRIVLVMCLIFAFLLGTCIPMETNAEQNHPLKIWKQNENGMFMTLNVVDERTGVNYVVVSGELYSEGIGIAMCPRYNADGSLYVTD